MEDHRGQLLHMGAVQGKYTGGISGKGRKKKTAGAAGYGSANNVKHGKMEDAFMNFALAKAAGDPAFTKLLTRNSNLYTKMGHQEYHIQSLKPEFSNLKLATSTQPTKVKIANNTVHPYERGKKQKPQRPTDPTKKYKIGITVGHMDTTK